jgi:uncharacterized protein DUF87
VAAPSRRGRREGAGWFRRSGCVDAPFLVPHLPSEVPFGFLGRLVPTTLRAEVRLQVHRIPPERALTLLDQARAVASAELVSGGSEPGARPVELQREAESANEIARRIAAREQELWRVGVSVHALGPNPSRADRIRADLVRRFRAAGFRPRIPTYESGPAARTPDLFGTEGRPPGYWHTLHSDGVAAFFPFTDESVTEPSGVLVGLLLDDASPVFLDRWTHASYSWGVFGATGSGKSFFTALTILRSTWMRPDLDVVVLDPLGEFAGLARELGGRVVSVADGRDGRWNPLDPQTTGGDAVEKAGRVGSVLRALFPSLRDEEVAVLDTALRRLYDRRAVPPQLSDLIEEVQRTPGSSGRLGSLLEVFRSGSLRHLDGPTTSLWTPGLTVVSLVGVPEGHLPFHLAYLLDAVYGHVRARPGPKLVIVDEAHLLARDPTTGAYLDRLVRHLRHYETGVIVASQNPDDFLTTEQGRSLLRNLRATFLLRLAEVSSATASFFQLTHAEAEWLPKARLPRETGYSEALLRFGASHLPLALIASTPEFDLLRRALGRPDERNGSAGGVPVQP